MRKLRSSESSDSSKVTWLVKVKVAQLYLTLSHPMGYTVHGILQARILEWVAFPFSRRSSQPRDRTQVSHISVDSLPAEPQGKPKNTGVGSLSLLRWIFPTQELNQGLLQADPLQTELSGKTTMLLLETNHTSIKKTHKTKGLSLLIAKNRLIPGLPCWSSG